MSWLTHFLAHYWLFHPMDTGKGSTCSSTDHSGCGYAGWSGWMGSVFWSIPQWILLLFLWARHHNCHVKGCLRRGHPDPEHGHPACKRHHSKAHLLGKEPA